jgi:hypothetical protein
VLPALTVTVGNCAHAEGAYKGGESLVPVGTES